MLRKIFISFFLLPIFIGIQAQNDSLSLVADSLQILPDTSFIKKWNDISTHKSFLENDSTQVFKNIQQLHRSNRNGYVFVFLIVLLAAVTYVKVAFGKEVEEMIQSIVNRNLSQQIYRTQSGEISFADVLLHINFIITTSLYIRFVLIKYFSVLSLEHFSTVLIFIFLFTFFYLAKIAVVLFIGKIFEQQPICNEYVFHFTTICKTLGLAMLPALFVFYAAPSKFFNFMFGVTVLIFFALIPIFVWRALSTAYKLLYNSLYHFFIYVCIIEISMMFLFFKLLTKTII